MGKEGIGMSFIASRYADEDVQEFVSKYDLDKQFPLVAANPGVTINRPPKGHVGVYHQFLAAGLRFLAFPFLGEVLNYYKIHICQIPPNGFRRIIHFAMICDALKISPRIGLFRYFYITMNRGDWLAFTIRHGGKELCKGTPDSIRDWKDEFFFVPSSAFPFSMELGSTTKKSPDVVYSLSDSEQVDAERLMRDAIRWHEPDDELLGMCGLHPSWNKEGKRPAYFVDGKYVPVLGILKGEIPVGTVSCSTISSSRILGPSVLESVLGFSPTGASGPGDGHSLIGGKQPSKVALLFQKASDVNKNNDSASIVKGGGKVSDKKSVRKERNSPSKASSQSTHSAKQSRAFDDEQHAKRRRIHHENVFSGPITSVRTSASSRSYSKNDSSIVDSRPVVIGVDARPSSKKKQTSDGKSSVASVGNRKIQKAIDTYSEPPPAVQVLSSSIFTTSITGAASKVLPSLNIAPSFTPIVTSFSCGVDAGPSTVASDGLLDLDAGNSFMPFDFSHTSYFDGSHAADTLCNSLFDPSSIQFDVSQSGFDNSVMGKDSANPVPNFTGVVNAVVCTGGSGIGTIGVEMMKFDRRFTPPFGQLPSPSIISGGLINDSDPSPVTSDFINAVTKGAREVPPPDPELSHLSEVEILNFFRQCMLATCGWGGHIFSRVVHGLRVALQKEKAAAEVFKRNTLLLEENGILKQKNEELSKALSESESALARCKADLQLAIGVSEDYKVKLATLEKDCNEKVVRLSEEAVSVRALLVKKDMAVRLVNEDIDWVLKEGLPCSFQLLLQSEEFGALDVPIQRSCMDFGTYRGCVDMKKRYMDYISSLSLSDLNLDVKKKILDGLDALPLVCYHPDAPTKVKDLFTALVNHEFPFIRDLRNGKINLGALRDIVAKKKTSTSVLVANSSRGAGVVGGGIHLSNEGNVVVGGDKVDAVGGGNSSSTPGPV